MSAALAAPAAPSSATIAVAVSVLFMFRIPKSANVYRSPGRADTEETLASYT